MTDKATKFEALPPVHRFYVHQNNSTASDLGGVNPPKKTHTRALYTQKQPQTASSSAGATIAAATRPSSRVLTPTLKQGDSESTASFTRHNSSSKKSQHLSMSDLINVSPANENAYENSLILHNTAIGLPSSPLTKMSKAITSNSSRGTMVNYTYDFTYNKQDSSPNETTVVPFDMEIKPQYPRKFDGGSNLFNSSFMKKNKPFPITQFASTTMAPPRSDDSQNMSNQHLILSDDLILSRFDTSFPDPKPLQELFAFDDNVFPSSTPSAPSALPSAPPTAEKTSAPVPSYGGKKQPAPKPPTTPSTTVAKTGPKTTSKPPPKKPPASMVTKPKAKPAGKRPLAHKAPLKGPYKGAYASSVTIPKPTMISSSSCSPPPTLPPPTPIDHELACKMSLPSISQLMQYEVKENPSEHKTNDDAIKDEMIKHNEESIHSMRLRNRKPTDYTHHISLSQLSGTSDTSSPMGTQSSEVSVYDPTHKKKKALKRSIGSISFPSSPLEYYSAHKKPPIKRTRVFLAGRSRNGCWTCRIRKKKCTEEKPHCSQCDKLGLTCDGYSDERPEFMESASTQRKRLDEIKSQTSKSKKVGIKKGGARG